MSVDREVYPHPPVSFCARSVKLTADELRKRLREELSAYKVPRHFFFFERDELPFTDSGKMPKKILTAMLIERLEKDE